MRMNRKLKYIISTLLVLGILLIISIKFGPKDDISASNNNVTTTQLHKITSKDVVGTWVNHHNKNLHQKITFTKNHKWKENQHGITNIYSGTWKIVGKRTIRLAPYDEKIVFNKHNKKQMNVVNYNHILNKN
ncbi:hypothetical protein FC97_GL000954 [Companilactobacillus kimchii DSM 13961 = JCM 10707]|uniref:Extracellular protein n=2 Tax=Companilactobacillus kimchii TaxID=2801452 RepID=A0ABR5NSW6_9LACO|nr:hypothetical protein FC97_GL000954 [Companilactobacillus kimchii DSM 13961 = JCM 10707]